MGWSKDAQKLGASAAEVKAVQDAEQKGTRTGVEAAIKAIEKNKKLDPLTKKMRDLLKQDEDRANKLKALQGQAATIEGSTKGIEAGVAGLKVPTV
jgi:hypothetical protein